MKIGKRYYSLAADYAHLVGKYVCMERYAEPGDPEFESGTDVGAEFTVAYVRDAVEEMEDAVEIMGDYGMGFVIYPLHHDWRFTVWESEETRNMWRPELPKEQDPY